jgi:hypothetical protein
LIDDGMEICSKSSREDAFGDPGWRERLDKSGSSWSAV